MRTCTFYVYPTIYYKLWHDTRWHQLIFQHGNFPRVVFTCSLNHHATIETHRVTSDTANVCTVGTLPDGGNTVNRNVKNSPAVTSAPMTENAEFCFTLCRFWIILRLIPEEIENTVFLISITFYFQIKTSSEPLRTMMLIRPVEVDLPYFNRLTRPLWPLLVNEVWEYSRVNEMRILWKTEHYGSHWDTAGSGTAA